MSDKFIRLCTRFKLADQDLDKVISNLHFDEISQTRDINWKSLPSRLGLQDNVAKDIDKDFSKEFDKRREFFQQWKQKNGSEATYRSLVRALLDIKQIDNAEYVCELLQQTVGEASGTDLSPTTPQDPPHPQPKTMQGNEHQFPVQSEDGFHYLEAENLDQSKVSDKIIRSLCVHFELADQDLDKVISDFHLDEIAQTRDIINWKSLPSLLGLRDNVAKDIDKDFTKDFDKRREFFQRWKRIKGSEATYRSLVKALLDINQRHEAEHVCKLLRLMVADTWNSSDSHGHDDKAASRNESKDVEEDDTLQKFVEEINEAVTKDKKFSRKLAHGILIGPTGAGKSSLMDRLLGRKKRKGFSSSTGVSESVVMIDVDLTNPSTFHSATVEGDAWREVEFDTSLARQMEEGIASLSKDDELSVSPAVANAGVELSAHLESLPLLQNASQPTSTDPKPAVETRSIAVVVSAPTVRKVIDHIVKKCGGTKQFKHFLKKSFSLYLRDTGGQVEFQEMVPLLISGPSIFFFVFRLDLDFKKKLRVEYRKSKGESLNSYTSSITTEEAFLQSLASVDSMDISDEVHGVDTHKPLVFVVGTHKDKLGSLAAEKIAVLNEHLKSLIKAHHFEHLVQSADREKGHVMFTVDNTSEDDTDFQLIRLKVNSLVRGRKEFTIEYPLRYLLFCLELQNVKATVLTLDECKAMAAKFGIKEDQLLHLLQFLHLRIGVIRYFNKDGVRHIVIKEPQVLFNAVTNLIVTTFSSEVITDEEASNFQKKGILTASVLDNVSALCDITPEVFLELLVHLRIAAPFVTPGDQDEEKNFFLPSVLNHVPESTGDLEEPATDVLPLAVQFKCQHCPKGLFGVLVTHLMMLNDGATTTFTLMPDRVFKNQVSFIVCSRDSVHDQMALKVHTSHLEMKFFPGLSEDREVSITEVCSNVRQIVESAIHQSLRDLHYSEYRAKPKMCFRCTNCDVFHPVSENFCPRNNATIPEGAKWWYNIEGPNTDEYLDVGPTADEYLDACRHVLATQECVEMWFLKVILLGFPRLGKTTMRRRLTGEIDDISSSEEEEQPSTGIVESGPSVVIRNLSSTTALITESNWLATKDLTEETCALIQYFYNHISEKKKAEQNYESDSTISTNAESRRVDTEKDNEVSDEEVQATDSIPVASKDSDSAGDTLSDATPSLPPASSNHEDYSPPPQYRFRIPKMIRNAVSPECWKEITEVCKDTAFLNIGDAGGQPEFMDMLPALTVGPALYLFFCKLTDDLNEPYKVSYRNPSTGESTVLRESTYTAKEVLFTSMASIACFKSFSSTSFGEATSSTGDQLLASCNKSIAYIVGTHKDLVSEGKINDFDTKLKDCIQPTDFFKKGIVRYFSEERMIIPIDNMDGGRSEVDSVRKVLEKVLKKHFKKLSIPASWFILSLCLRESGKKVATLESVLQVASKLGIKSEKEAKLALWFLHHYAGVLMYFPNLPELEDTVICDNQIIYDSATILIVNTFKFRSVGEAASERFRKTGQFSLEDIREATAGVSGDYISLEKLVKLLAYLNILVSSRTSSSEEMYFMPSALQNATHEEMAKWWDEQKSPVLALFITYQCGFVPIGVFSAMIASLTAKTSLTLRVNGIRKNRVEFQYGRDFDEITLVSQPTYYAVHILRSEDAKTPVHEVCPEVRGLVESTLKTVASRMNYSETFTAEYQLGFECPSHPGREHLCVVDSNDPSPYLMRCQKYMNDLKSVDMHSHHKVWFGEALSDEAESEAGLTVVQPNLPHHQTRLEVKVMSPDVTAATSNATIELKVIGQDSTSESDKVKTPSSSNKSVVIVEGVSISFIVGGVLSFLVAIAFLAVGGVRGDDAYIRSGVGMLVTGLTAIITVIMVRILMAKCCKYPGRFRRHHV